jgi:hypothetical protein
VLLQKHPLLLFAFATAKANSPHPRKTFKKGIKQKRGFLLLGKGDFKIVCLFFHFYGDIF